MIGADRDPGKSASYSATSIALFECCLRALFKSDSHLTSIDNAAPA